MKEQTMIFRECTGYISTLFAGLLKDPDFKEYDGTYKKRLDETLMMIGD